MASSDDEDLKAAISLSLQEEGHQVINIDSDDDNVAPKHVDIAGNKTTAPISGLLGLDRKKMEQERLARKRKVSLSPSPTRKAQKTGNIGDTRSLEASCRLAPDSKSRISASLESPLPSKRPSGSCFLKPVVKKTWALGHERTGNDIKLEEVLQKNDLILAVLSSFQWDIEWLFAKLDTTSTQITLVMQAKYDAQRAQYRRETLDMQNLRLCFPPMGGQVNCMHSKLMLLSHPTYLRIAVPTANLVSYDWGESGTMENSVFLVDLPRMSAKRRPETQTATAFEKELVYFLNAMGLEQSIIDSISNFDFAATKELAFVHSVGGAHTGESWRSTGYCGLGRAVRDLGLATALGLEIDFITSSVGSLNIDFLAMLYLAAQGDDGTTEYGWRNPQTGKNRGKTGKSDPQHAQASQQKIKDEVCESFRIYFPTQNTVKSSTAGYAGTICFQSKWYNSPTFPRQALRDCKSVRTGLLMHNKIIYVRTKENDHEKSAKENKEHKSWVYIGSANCSESAWGKLSKDRATKLPKLNCRNWECGVLIPVEQAGRMNAEDGLGAFEDIVPVPMQYPGDPYGDRKPWYYAEQ